MKDFWKKQVEKHKKLVFLAPMDWYWDSAYRQAMRKIAPDIYLISEFYSADWLVHSKFLADSVLPHETSEDPLVVQIFGKDPEMFAKAAEIISNPKYNIAGIDVNMWCPAKKVVRSGHGSSLFINQDTAFRIIESLNKATHLPISVKTRLSFDGTQSLVDFAKGLENAGCSLLTVHGRTAKQAYTGNADFTNIYQLKNHINIPLICNGDILNYEDWMKKVQNLDGFMIWRWSFWNPWAFLPWNVEPTLKEILDMMEFHALKLVETKWERKWSLEIRKHLVQYLSSFPWVKAYRKRLVTTESLENSLWIIREISWEFKEFLDKKPGMWEITKESIGLWV
jgi:tRNA-dihydrouridine synthase B